MTKIKLTDGYGNDLLDENGCVQYKNSKLAKEKVLNGQHYAVHVKENEEGIIIDVWHRNGELIDTYTYWNEDTIDDHTKQCAVCNATFTQYKDAKTADERTLCEYCRQATSKLK